MSFLEEIKRRKVFQVAVVYVIVAWALMQVVDVINDPLNLPDWFDTVVIVLLGLGFPIALIVSWAFDLTPQGITRDAGAGQTKAEPAPSQYGKLTFIAVLILAALLAVNILIDLLPENGPTTASLEQNPIRRFTLELPRSLRAQWNGLRPAVISPDGQRVVFNQVLERQAKLFSRSFDSLDTVPIAGSEGASRVYALSPDGQWIAFYERVGGLLKKIPVHGGVPVTLCDPQGFVWGLTWSANGVIAFESESYNGLMSVPASGGMPERLTFPDEGEVHKQARFLSGGDALVFTIGERGLTTRKADRIGALSLRSGERKSLMAGSSPSVTANGKLIYYRDGTLWAVDFGADRLEILSDSIPVAENVVYANDAHYSVSNDGTLVYVLETSREKKSLVWVDRQGNQSLVPVEPRAFSMPRVSPEGDRVAVVIDAPDGTELWMHTLTRGITSRLTFDEARETSPLWSKDGNYIIYSSNRVDDLFRVTADGTGLIEQLTATATYQFADSITPDGSQIIISERGGNRQRIDLAVLTLADSPSAELLVQTEFSDSAAALSPDGKWVAYASDRSGQQEVYLSPFPDAGTGRWQVTTDGGWTPVWGKDNTELFFWGGEEVMAVTIRFSPEPNISLPKPLFSHAEFIFNPVRDFDYDRNSDRFMMLRTHSEDEIPNMRVVVVQGWLDEVSRKLAE